MWYLIALILCVSLLGGVIYFARQDARKSARLDALKKEAKEIARAQAIADNVRRESIDSVRDKLKQTK